MYSSIQVDNPCQHTTLRAAGHGICPVCDVPAPAEFGAELLATYQELAREVCRESFGEFIAEAWPAIEPNGRPFVPNIATEAIIEHLQAIADGKIKRLLIEIAPGLGKSSLTSIAFLPWLWARNPAYRAIHASHSHDLAVAMSRRARRLIDSEWYRGMLGIELRTDQNRVDDFENTLSGRRLAVGVGGSLTGSRADAAIVDDSLNAVDATSKAIRESVNDWFDNALSTRLDNSDHAPIVVIQQRLHSADLIGHLTEQGGWERLCLPSEYDSKRRSITCVWKDPRENDGDLLAPTIHSKEFLTSQKKVLGSAGYSCQYLQAPTDNEGGLFQRSWWRFHKPDGTAAESSKRPRGCTDIAAVALPAKFDQKIISIDCSFKGGEKNDYVAMVAIGAVKADRYVLEMIRRKMDFMTTCKVLKEMRTRYPNVKVLIEDAANGPAVVSALGREISGLIPVKPEGGKESRASAVSPQVESGNVFLPEGAAWLGDFVEEFAGFPRSKHDDAVDALSQGLIHLNTHSIAWDLWQV